MNEISPSSACPCGSSKTYGSCCHPIHQQQSATTPEQLMRSRYSAFVLKQFDYLIATHHPDFRGALAIADLADAQPDAWLGLQVFSSAQQTNQGEVHFCAWFRDDEQLGGINEVSQFVLQDGHWFYTSGKQLPVKLPGRNEQCVCTSGKKFKQCCGK